MLVSYLVPGGLQSNSVEPLAIVASRKTVLVGDLPVVLNQVDILVVCELVRRQLGVERSDLGLVRRIGGQSRRDRNPQKHRVGQMAALAVVVKEEEILVFDHGTADRAAKLIDVIWLDRNAARI